VLNGILHLGLDVLFRDPGFQIHIRINIHQAREIPVGIVPEKTDERVAEISLKPLHDLESFYKMAKFEPAK
jgi:hypothetical protein